MVNAPGQMMGGQMMYFLGGSDDVRPSHGRTHSPSCLLIHTASWLSIPWKIVNPAQISTASLLKLKILILKSFCHFTVFYHGFDGFKKKLFYFQHWYCKLKVLFKTYFLISTMIRFSQITPSTSVQKPQKRSLSNLNANIFLFVFFFIRLR